jgi:CRP-like cAMP-binding protein
MHALMHIDARHRLLGTLLSLARRFESDDRGWVQLPHAITQSDLANIACLNRTTVSYHLNVLRASGVLGGVRRDLIIKTDLVASLLKEIGLELLE